MTPKKPLKRGPKPRPKAQLLSERMTLRLTKGDKAAIERLAGDRDPSEWAREKLLRVVAREADQTVELGPGLGRILVVDGSVWWSPGLGQWVPLVTHAAGQSVVVGSEEDPTEAIRFARAKEAILRMERASILQAKESG